MSFLIRCENMGEVLQRKHVSSPIDRSTLSSSRKHDVRTLILSQTCRCIGTSLQARVSNVWFKKVAGQNHTNQSDETSGSPLLDIVAKRETNHGAGTSGERLTNTVRGPAVA